MKDVRIHLVSGKTVTLIGAEDAKAAQIDADWSRWVTKTVDAAAVGGVPAGANATLPNGNTVRWAWAHVTHVEISTPFADRVNRSPDQD